MGKPRETKPLEARQRICSTVDSIPPGSVASYGQVAEEAGLPRRARLVGRVLGEQTEGTELPWHRVVNAAGALSTRGGAFAEQRRRLEEEGVEFRTNGSVDLERHRWQP